MTDREIFRNNLNYYLQKSGKMQKDLADAIGAKYTTVSGWTRGISYPRTEAMEKIAMFFGIPTSKLIGNRESNEIETNGDPKIHVVSGLMENLSEEQKDQVVAIVLAAVTHMK